MATKNVKKRSEVEEQYTWKMEDIYATDDAWQAEYDQLQNLFKDLVKFEGHLADSAKSLYEFMNLYEKASLLFERIAIYANQRYHQDTGNSKYQNFVGKAASLEVGFESAVSFLRPEIIETVVDKIDSFYEELPELKKYQIFLSNIIRHKEHTLSKESEELIASAGEVLGGPSNIFSMFNNADIKFDDIIGEEGNPAKLTLSRYISFMESKDRRVREEAFHSMYKTYGQYRNTLAATYQANVKSLMFETKARKHNSNMEHMLFANNVPTDVYKNLIEVVHDNLDLMHRYVSLRKKILGVDELHMYDVYVPMISDVDKKFHMKKRRRQSMKH